MAPDNNSWNNSANGHSTCGSTFPDSTDATYTDATSWEYENYYDETYYEDFILDVKHLTLEERNIYVFRQSLALLFFNMLICKRLWQYAFYRKHNPNSDEQWYEPSDDPLCKACENLCLKCHNVDKGESDVLCKGCRKDSCARRKDANC